jgi:8-oxo-dGTP pyrophosphatase MutT (NUDIX family)
MAKAIKQKIPVYCMHAGRLLVFRHVALSWEEAGIQVPGGSSQPGEALEAAALRELCEETGTAAFPIEAFLGVAHYDITPYRRELQEHYFFCASPTAQLPERWLSQENHDGAQPPTRFECFWLPLASAQILQSGQRAMLWRLAE